MTNTLVFLQLAHRTINRLLKLIEEQCSRIDSGEPADYALLGLVFAYLREYPKHCQHPKSAIVFRRLEIKDADAAAEAGYYLVGQGPVAELTERVAELVDRAKDEDPIRVLEMRHALRSYIHEYKDHLEAEESRFFPALTSTLTRDDWDLIDYQMFDQDRPIYDSEAEDRFLRLRQQILEVDSNRNDPRESA